MFCLKNAAGILGTKSPITYLGWKSGEKKSVKYGMNFAYGGTGVFNTFVNQPNMTTQIDYFQQFVHQKKILLNSSSIAILSVAGNDYATYFTSNHTLKVTSLIIFKCFNCSTKFYKAVKKNKCNKFKG